MNTSIAVLLCVGTKKPDYEGELCKYLKEEQGNDN